MSPSCYRLSSRLIIALALLAMTGCATGNRNIHDPAKVGSLQVGVTTMAEARAILGEPDARQEHANGNAAWVYKSVDKNTLGTLITHLGTATGAVLGGLGVHKILPKDSGVLGSVATAAGAVVGSNIGREADRKARDSLKNEYNSLTLQFRAGVLSDYVTGSVKK